jgi:hypothetical protein
MTLQNLFDSITNPTQKKVAYGIYWSINKMNKIGTKAVYFDNIYTFTQWISFKDADYIGTKLEGFQRVYKGYEAECNIGGYKIWVKYHFGMNNRNAKITIELVDTEKEKRDTEEKQKVANENKEMLGKILFHMRDFLKENKNCTDAEYNTELSKFDEKYVKLFSAQFK